MPDISQEQRLLAVSTPLGPDTLLLAGFKGMEALSQPFRFELDLMSQQETIAPADLVGKPVSWRVGRTDDAPRYFHGIVSRLYAGGRDKRGLRAYRAEVVPWLWFLTRTADCKIFQQLTTPDIIKKVFDGLGFSDYEVHVKGAFPTWDYCVQYRETAFNFVSRLMELEGIFYYFTYTEEKHTLVLANDPSEWAEVPESPALYAGGTVAKDHVTSWEHSYEYRSGKWTRTDYNFETPGTSLLTTTGTVVNLPSIANFEVFEYPGAYLVKGDGEPVTKIRMEEDEAAFDVVLGGSECCTFTAGGKFTLQEHEIDAENASYAFTAVQHAASEASYSPGAGGSTYTNSFTCIPASVKYRPPRVTRKPAVAGPQTAVVVGPAGEEIYVDKYGRVKVQFFWDRLGKNDEKSSCWVRVSEQWAGKNWGFVANPRIGQEVIVDFIEGDPDRPLITGRVYNAEQMPPYDLPANMTQTGIKSRSSKGGGTANFNEFRFEDKKGSEQVFLHAEKNQDIEVEHDETHWVGHDRTKTIDNDETVHVKRNRTETVDNDESITIGNNRSEEVKKDESITIGNNRSEEVKKDESIKIGNNRTEEVGKQESVTIGESRTTEVGKNETVTIKESRQEEVGKNETVSIGENREVTVGKNDQLSVAKVLVINAGDQITIQTGEASIMMKKDGTIQISGKDITISGSGKINAKASGDMTLKGSKVAAN